jgi:hypothetical protein
MNSMTGELSARVDLLTKEVKLLLDQLKADVNNIRWKPDDYNPPKYSTGNITEQSHLQRVASQVLSPFPFL